MKKSVKIGLLGLCLFTLAACGKKEEESKPEEPKVTQKDPKQKADPSNGGVDGPGSLPSDPSLDQGVDDQEPLTVGEALAIEEEGGYSEEGFFDQPRQVTAKVALTDSEEGDGTNPVTYTLYDTPPEISAKVSPDKEVILEVSRQLEDRVLYGRLNFKDDFKITDAYFDYLTPEGYPYRDVYPDWVSTADALSEYLASHEDTSTMEQDLANIKAQDPGLYQNFGYVLQTLYQGFFNGSFDY